MIGRGCDYQESGTQFQVSEHTRKVQYGERGRGGGLEILVLTVIQSVCVHVTVKISPAVCVVDVDL